MRRSTARILIPIFLFLGSVSFGEDFRGSFAAQIVVPDSAADDGTAQASMEYLEIVSIDLDRSARFVQGIELDLRIPKIVQDFPGSFIFYVYKNVKPTPAIGTIGYSGQPILSQVPQKISTILQIPIIDTHALKPTPYTVLLKNPVKPEEFPIALYFMPIMKGLPSELESASFSVKS